MDRPEITKPIVISFGITIAVPIPISFSLDSQRRDVYEWEKYVIKKRDKAVDQVEKKSLDQCRAVFQWAIACSASLNTAERRLSDNSIEFSFVFDNLDTMLKFKEELNTRIESFMIF